MKEGSRGLSRYDNAFKIAEGNGTLTVEMVNDRKCFT